MSRMVAFLVGLVVVGPASWAQAPGSPAPAASAGASRPAATPPPPGPAGIGAPVMLTADREIPVDQAIEAASAAMKSCLSMRSAAVVAVVDLNGHYKALLRADGTGLPFYEYMRRKAYTVLKKQMPSGVFGKLPGVAGLPRNAVIEGDPNLITFPGAVPIMRGGNMIGVLSVSGPTGGDDDLKCALAGMAALHL